MENALNLHFRFDITLKMSDSNNDQIIEIIKRAIRNEFALKNEIGMGNNEIEIYSFKESTGSGLSDNFGGVLRLVEFTYNVREQIKGTNMTRLLLPVSKEHSYFVKSLPENPLVKDMLESVSILYFQTIHFLTLFNVKVQNKFDL